MGDKRASAPGVREAVTLLSDHCNWLTETRLLETNWDRLQRRGYNLYEIACLYHENTKMRPYQGFEVALSTEIYRQPSIIEGASRTNREYGDRPATKLPVNNLDIRRSLTRVMYGRRSHRRFRPQAMTLEHLSSLLYHTNGITCRFDFREMHTGKPLTQYFRASPSGGGLYCVELYVVPLNVQGLDQSVYHYNVFEHSLERMSDSLDLEGFLGMFPVHPDIVRIDESAMVLIMTGDFERNYAKYGSRGYRYVLQESGHICQNAWLAAEGMGYGAVSLAGFYDDEINGLLDVDGVDEAALYVLVCGVAADQTGISMGPQHLAARGPRPDSKGVRRT